MGIVHLFGAIIPGAIRFARLTSIYGNASAEVAKQAVKLAA